MNILEAQDLTIGYSARGRPKHVVAENLNPSVSHGELVCLIGPNGAGKTTLLRTLAGMQPPLFGRVLLQGDDIRQLTSGERARRLSIVLTERVDVGMMTAYALVALGRHPYTDWSGKLTHEDESVVQRAIESLNAHELAHRFVSELSDGERQKIMIARALAQEPKLMILDEPTAFLDLPRRVEIMQVLSELARINGQAVLLSTHDLDLALRNADRIWLMTAQGQLQMGAPEDLVLSGAFDATFHSEGVKFDTMTGSFMLTRKSIGVMGLKGEGIHAVWTQRALERAGYEVVTGETVPSVAAAMVDGCPHWEVNIGSSKYRCESIYDLITFLKNMLPDSLYLTRGRATRVFDPPATHAGRQGS